MDKISRSEIIKEIEKYFKPGWHLVKDPKVDFRVPSFFTTESLSEAASFQVFLDDVFVVTFPKAGTTWTQQIVKLLRNNGENDGKLLVHSVPWIAANSGKLLPKIDLDSLPKPRSFKSHMPYNHTPGGPPNKLPCKYICVARNPKDSMVSFYYHYCRAYVKHDSSVQLPWDLFYRYYLNGDADFGDYFNHVLSWWAHKDDENVLFLKYEDMKKDLPGNVTKIANFIGADLLEEAQAKVVAQTTFDAMKKDDTANYSFSNSRAKPGSEHFIRKGEVGDWKHLFTAEQSAEVDRMFQERFAGTGLVFDFGD